MELTERPRRLRSTPVLRKMVRETRIDQSSLIYPMFVKEGKGIKEEIPTMPGQFRYSVDMLPAALEEVAASGVLSVMLFGIPDEKDECGTGAWAQDGIIQKALKEAKRTHPDLYYITDVCMCEYTSHGHCGILNGQQVDNDRTLEVLNRTAPSDMMDGRVAAIREILDQNRYENVPIMSYAAKYASSFYGPFRDAAGSAPAFGDRKAYQMDYHNRKEALKEVLTDCEEGADIIMVKPALSYLDIIRETADQILLPVAAYSVSGEYAMIKAAAQAGYVDEAAMICETAVSIYRAGCGILLSYYAKEIAGFIEEGRIG